MPITRAILAEIKDHGYPPELIPSAEGCSPLATNLSLIMDIPKTPKGMMTIIHDIYADQDNDAELRVKANNHEVICPSAAIPDWNTPTLFDLYNQDEKPLRIAVYAVANLTDYPVCHGLYAWMATVADKLAMRMPLTAEEQALDTKLGISATYQRGTLPLKMPRYYLSEYVPIYRETKSVRETVPTSGADIDRISPIWAGDSFVALEKVSLENSASVNNTRLTICRDEDGSQGTPFIELNAVGMALDFELPMFIPAMRELSLRVETDVQKDDYELRYTYCHYQLSNIHRCRWGLLSRDEAPGDLFDKVRAGVV